jgi:two-component system response regulator VanR
MRKRVLLVEDDDGLREIITDYFEESGFIVDGASDGLTALELWDKDKYDLALIDLMLPGLAASHCAGGRKSSDVALIILPPEMTRR